MESLQIRILDDVLVNKIAAGEVVERPASVVKELVENALDAGAKVIRVTLRGGGRSLVRVADDGCGMTRDDALMCLERHATSKIRTEADLHRVETLGFRGEALPSIAAVCRFQLSTRPHDQETGTGVKVEGGRVQGVSDVGCAPGTEIDVRSLFYNLPVRRKFLRTTATELGHCVQAVARQAMARPDVDFTILHDGREVLRAPVVKTLAARARDLMGRDATRLFEVSFESLGFAVSGLASPPGIHRGSRAGAIYAYVNGRFVRDPVLHRAIAEAYRGLVPKGRHPLAVLDVRLDPTRVDVNVHPTKIEVRFRDPRDLVAVVSSGLREVLSEQGVARPVGPTAQRRQGTVDQAELPLPAHPDDDPRRAQPSSRAPAGSIQYGRKYALDGQNQPTSPPSPPANSEYALTAAEPEGASEERTRYRELRLIGQLGDASILCELAGDLIAIDTVAARKGVIYRRLAGEHARGDGGAQRLLTPAVVELTSGDVDVLEAHADLLSSVHVDIDRFGPGSIAVRAVPNSLERVEADVLMSALAVQLAKGGSVHEVLRVMADHAATRATEPLGDYDVRALLASLDELDDTGRLGVRISAEELSHRLG